MRLVVKMSFVMLMLIVVATGCGGGGDDVSPSTTPTRPTEPETPQAGSNAPYTVSVVNGSVGAAAVNVSADTITVQGRTVRLESATQVGFQSGHHRAFDTPGATSGPALDVHFFGDNDGYDYVRFGSWAKGVVSPNPGFTIGNEYGAFLAFREGSRLTPVSNMPTVGAATYRGHYAGYVDREGVGVSQVVGQTNMVAHFTAAGNAIEVVLLPPDPNRSSFAVVPTEFLGYQDQVMMVTPILGNTFQGDVTDTLTIGGVTVPGGTGIAAVSALGRCPCLYSIGQASSGGIQGGFFGRNADEAGGTYQFTIGRTKAAGSFGVTLQ